MSSIDERIVEMKFQNGQFEKGIAQTSESLEKFKKQLNLDGATSGLDAVGKAAQGLRIDGIADGVDNISSKFNILGAVGFTAIQKLTNQAMSLGASLVKNVFDPIVEGGSRRAQNIEHAKFMLDGLKVAWDDIVPSINYAVDGTAYGLDEAARAASSLVASQVPLEDMGDALRGISGVAAMTGGTYSDIAQIFTTVAGNGRLMSSELNRIGQRGINAAAALAEFLNVSETEVREMTSKGMIDFQTFSQAMNSAFGEQATKANETYAGSLANVRAALARIGQAPAEGKFERLRLIFNALRPRINEVKEALDPLLNMLKDMQIKNGERLAKIIEGIDLSQLGPGFQNIADGVQNVMDMFGAFGKIAGDAFRAAFPKTQGTWFVTITKGFKNLTEAIKPSESTLNKFKNVLTVVAEVLATVWYAIKRVWDVIKAFGGVLWQIIKILWDFVEPFFRVESATGDASDTMQDFFQLLRDGVDNGLVPIVEFLTKVREKLEEMREGGTSGIEFLDKLYETVKTFSENAREKIDWFFQAFKDGMESLVAEGSLFDRVKNFFLSFTVDDIDLSPVETFKNWFTETFKNLGNILGDVWDVMGPIVSDISTGFKNLLDGLWDFISGITMMDLMAAGQVAAVIGVLWMFYQHMKSIRGVMNSFSGLMDAFAASITSADKKMKKAFTIATILSIAFSIALLAGALWLLAKIPVEKLISAGIALGVIAVGLFLMVKGIEKISKTLTPEQAKNMMRVSGAMIIMSVAVALLAVSVEKLSALSWEALGKGVGSVVVLLGSLVLASRLMSRESKGMIKAAFAIGIMAGSLLILVGVVKAFGNMDADILKQGGLTVAIAIAALASAIALMSLPKNNANILKAGVAIALMVGSLWLLAGVLKSFGSMKWEDISLGVYTLGGALIALTAVAVILGKSGKDALLGAAALAVLAGSLVIIGAALQIVAAIQPESLLGSVLALGVIVALLAFIAQTLNGVDAIMAASSMAIMAGSLLILAVAINSVADVDTGKLFGIVIAMGILVGLMAVIALVVGKSGIAIAALAVMAVAIAAVAAVLFGVGFIIQSITGLIEAFVSAIDFFIQNASGMADAMIIVAEATEQMAPYVWTMAGVGLAFIALGIGAAIAAGGLGLLGIALLAMGIGLAAIAMFGPLGVVALVSITETIAGLLEYAWPITAMGAAFLVLGVGLLSMGAGGLVASLGLFAFGSALKILIPSLMMMGPALDVLADAAIRNASALKPLLALGLGLTAFGAGAMVAGVGSLLLGTGLIVLGTGLMMIAAFGPRGADAMVQVAETLAPLWKEGLKLAAVTAIFIALGASLVVMGAGLMLAGAGGMVFISAFRMLIASIPMVTAALDVFAAKIPGIAARIGRGMKTLSAAISTVAPQIAASIMIFAAAAMMATPAMMMFATGMSLLAAGVPPFSVAMLLLGKTMTTVPEQVSSGITQIADSISSGATEISAGISLLGTSIASSITDISAAFLALGVTMMSTLSQGVTEGLETVRSAMATGIMTILQSLVTLVVGMASIFMVGGVALGTAMARGIQSSSGLVRAATIVAVMMMVTAVASSRGLAQTAGLVLLTGFVAGVISGTGTSRSAGITVAVAFVTGLSSASRAANSSGKNAAKSFVNGLSSGMSGASATGYSGGYEVGRAITDGAAAGVRNGSYNVTYAIRSMAQSAVAAAKSELDVRSPSRVFGWIFDMVTEGSVNSLKSGTRDVSRASANMGTAAISSMRDSINGIDRLLDMNMDMSPKIRPVLDLSEVEKTAGSLGSILDVAPIRPITTADMASSHSNLLAKKELEKELVPAGGGDTYYNFEQNIVSPKAVSTTEIYRNTKNLVSKSKKVGD